MGSSEELRFDFEVSSEHVDVLDEPTAADSDQSSKTADHLLARIAAVKSASVRQRTRTDGSVERDLVAVSEVRERVELEIESGGRGSEDDEDAESGDEALTIAEFYQRVRWALAREFPDEVWVAGEIRGLRESRGHRYLELADHVEVPQGRNAAQQLEVVCWSRDWPTVAAALAEAGVELEVGRVVRVRGKVSVWDGGSKLRFTLTALDVEALLGGIAAARRRLLALLAEEGLLEKNRGRVLPLVPLRIGVVTSPGSEAHRDFVGQLERSPFAFEVLLEPSLVQGAEAPNQIAAALARLAGSRPDLAVVVRGGGARGDLAAFDSEIVARAIAEAPFPVWTGIGHTGDRSVADEVAHRALITPTACGEAVVARVADFWGDVDRRVGVLCSLARARLDAARHGVLGQRRALGGAARHQLERRGAEVHVATDRVIRLASSMVSAELARIETRAIGLGDATRRSIAAAENALERRTSVLRAFDPRRQLERGWTLTRTEQGILVRSAKQVTPGEVLLTRFADGEVRSVSVDPVQHAETDENRIGR